jgi:hypothetical protein
VSVVGLLAVGGAAGACIAIGRTATSRGASARSVIRYVLPAAAATLLLTPALIRSLPVFGLGLACVPGYLGYRFASRYMAVKQPRHAISTLLEGRLKKIIGAPWTGQAMRIDYATATGATHADISAVAVQLPRNLLPSRVIDDCKVALSETLSGKWSSSVKGTVITFKPKVEIADPEPLRHLKGVLRDASALGADARVEVLEYSKDSCSVIEFQAFASQALSNVVASVDRQRKVEQLIGVRVPIAEGSWACSWELTGTPVIHCRRSAFRDVIYMKPPEHFVTSKAEAAEFYPKAVFEVGVHEDGRICTRTPIKEPHGITAGSTGKGKTTHLHAGLVSATACGFVGIVADGKFSDSFIGFMDWPNVQIVANDIFSIIRVIYFVAEMLSRRQEGGRDGEFPIDRNIPVWFIIDEHQYLLRQIQKYWLRYKEETAPLTNPVADLLDELAELARQFRVHMENGTQKPESKNISQNIISLSDKKSQWGDMSGAQSQAYWYDYHTGQSVPPIVGRGVIKTISGKPEPLQGFYAPDPAKAKTPEEFELLAKLMPPVSLHRRIVFDIPDPDESSWKELTTAPWYFAEDRPGLDPLSPQYAPRPFMKFNTFGNLNPATLDLDDNEEDT